VDVAAVLLIVGFRELRGALLLQVNEFLIKIGREENEV
jgi:hypothetical protein